MRRIHWVLTLLLSLAVARDARAYKCTYVEESNVSQAWLDRCIPYAITCQNDLLLDPKMQDIVTRSFKAWEDVSCSDLSFERVGFSPELEAFDVENPDGQFNTIAAIDSNEEDIFPDPRLLALTFTHFAVATGELLDADILFNAARFEFVDVDELSSCDRDSNVFDFENTLVHEIGHLVGFDHVEAEQATMFARAEACESLKRSLDQDDIDGICRVYPTGLPLNPCYPPENGYDNAPLDAEPYRHQCERFADGTMVELNLMECEAALEGGSGGICSCRTGGSARAGSELSFFLLGLFVIFRRVRRS